MELKLYNKDFEHVKEGSSYNHNYYKYIGKDSCIPTVIYERCDENYDTYDYSLKDGNDMVFLGSSQQSFSFDEIINIDFRMICT